MRMRVSYFDEDDDYGLPIEEWSRDTALQICELTSLSLRKQCAALFKMKNSLNG